MLPPRRSSLALTLRRQSRRLSKRRLRSVALFLLLAATLALLAFLLLSLRRNTAAQAALASHPPPSPPPALRIPRTLHFTLSPAQVRSAATASTLARWASLNPGWTLKRYTDAEAAAFVATEFPSLFATYTALPLPVARADLFRLLVLLRRGGVYADGDASPRQPLESLLTADDSLVACWENSFDTAQQASARHYVRTRQLLNWALAAQPGHPALEEAVERVSRLAASLPVALAAAQGDARAHNAAVMEHTGPGPLTDALLGWAAAALNNASAEQPGDAGDWPLRLLPRVAWGTHPKAGSADGVPQSAPEVSIAHGFAGGWKRRGGAQRLPWPLRPLLRPIERMLATPAKAGEEAAQAGAGDVFPVSCALESRGSAAQTFDVLLLPPSVSESLPRVHRVTSRHLFDWGVPPPRTAFSAAQALFGSHSPLSPALAAADQPRLFLDCGAGLGFYSLAAHSFSLSVLAFEPETPLHGPIRAAAALNAARAARRRRRAPASLRPPAPGRLAVSDAPIGSPQSPGFAAAWLGERLSDSLWLSDTGWVGLGGEGEARSERDWRASLSSVVSLDSVLRNASLLPSAGSTKHGAAPKIAALRLALRGWEGWALAGASELLASPEAPEDILVETQPARLARSGWGPLPQLLDFLSSRGYSSAMHAGPGCDAASRRQRGNAQPGVWCLLGRSEAQALAQLGPQLGGEAFEVLLFSRPAAVQSGFRRIVMRPGRGQPPSRGAVVTLRAVGWGRGGSEREEIWAQGAQSFSFRAGMGGVIRAWDEAVMQMRRGEVSRVISSPGFACVCSADWLLTVFAHALPQVRRGRLRALGRAARQRAGVRPHARLCRRGGR
jgi:hypothetical protein